MPVPRPGGLLAPPPGGLRYRGVVGTGGIGHGSFFLLEGNHELGREESRPGRFLDRRDYCKLHIISHYLSILLGPGVAVYPIGCVGDDDAGRRLRTEMEEVGIDTRFVRRLEGAPTLFSFCFVYPDGSGGNLTTVDSASGLVDAALVEQAAGVMTELGPQGIALAVPEVPLPARRALLKRACSLGLLRVSSFTREEVSDPGVRELLAMSDLCALNLGEAAAAAGLDESQRSGRDPGAIAEEAAERLNKKFPDLRLSITAGRTGSWIWSDEALTFDPAPEVQDEGTAGAGDAHLAGMLAGLCIGLPATEALQLATIVAAASVTSVHTIHPAMSRELLREVCGRRGTTAPRVAALLDSGNGGS